MNKFFLIFMFLNFTYLTTICSTHEQLECKKLARCYDAKTKTFRTAQEGEKGILVKGNPNAKSGDERDEHCVCVEKKE